MDQDRPSYDNQPITLQQKKTLITIYQQTGNMTLAMHKANIRSPKTAYLWWHRFCEAGEAALQPRSHARNTQKRLSDAVVQQICQLRSQQPQWGRRRIADELTQLYGQRVASPASVEAVLRRENLWEQTIGSVDTSQPLKVPDWLSTGVDYNLLLEILQTGIRHSVHSEAHKASLVLYGQVWGPLEADTVLCRRLLATPRVGSWLLSSRLHLGHSLMNSGRWSEAEQQLRAMLAWFQEQEDDMGVQRRPWEDEPNIVSLRRDDIWLDSYKHLGLVIGKQKAERGIDYLRTALNGIRRSHHPIMPTDKTSVGSLERDLANLKLRSRALAEEEIRQHLLQAQRNAEEFGGAAVQAFTNVTWAHFHSRLAQATSDREKGRRHQERERLQHSLDQALRLIETGQGDYDHPMQQTLCFTNTAILAQVQGMPIDEQRLRIAAQNCITYGFGHQAEKLLAMPDNHIWLPEEMRQNLIELCYG